jgi:hypothetical protein
MVDKKARNKRLAANRRQTAREYLLLFEDLAYIAHIGTIKGERWWVDRGGSAIIRIEAAADRPPRLIDVLQLVGCAYELAVCAMMGYRPGPKAIEEETKH